MNPCMIINIKNVGVSIMSPTEYNAKVISISSNINYKNTLSC